MKTALLVTLLASGVLAACRSAPPSAPPLDAKIVRMPSRTVLALAKTGPYAETEKTFLQMAEYVLSKGIPPEGDLMGIFHDDPATTPPSETRYEVWLPVAPGTRAEPPFAVKKVPAVTVAAVGLDGPYDVIARRYPDLYHWIRENGWVPAGPLMEVYLVHAGSGLPPERYRTDVMVPVEPAGKP